MDLSRFLSPFVIIFLIEFLRSSLLVVNGRVLTRREISPELENKTNNASVENRFNFNFNRGHAQAFSPYGSSFSDASTYGVNVGIERPGYQYQPLFSDSGAYSNSFGSPYGPKTWAHGNSHVRPGYAGGNINSGFSGGRGQAHSDSYSMVHRVPLNPFDGTVLLHNLPTHDNTNKSTDTSSTSNDNNESPATGNDKKAEAVEGSTEVKNSDVKTKDDQEKVLFTTSQ